MSVLNLRNVPPELVKKLKSDAALSGKTLREYVLEELSKAMGGGLDRDVVKVAPSNERGSPAVDRPEPPKPKSDPEKIPGVSRGVDPVGEAAKRILDSGRPDKKRGKHFTDTWG